MRSRLESISGLLAAAALAAGCGGEDSDDPGGGNSTPTISGSAPSQIAVGSSYSFTPRAGDADGDRLTFSVENLPVWASFDDATGTVSGTPTQADVDRYAGIRISVSDGNAAASLGAFSIDVVAVGSGSAFLTWIPPTRNTDGSELELLGYRIYWGPAEGNYTDSVTLEQPGVASYLVEGLTAGTWYFAASALNSERIESRLSNVASKRIQ